MDHKRLNSQPPPPPTTTTTMRTHCNAVFIPLTHPLSTLSQVTATDGDVDRPINIVYFLTGQGIDPDNTANSKFDINRTTGDIFVLKVSGTHKA